ncbi:MAG: bifunctional DNA primase/polymerase, partial [Chloroflexi bacterium]|nr:bifunctional DNA primase/polymerase [Chloroflexota bacterium]
MSKLKSDGPGGETGANRGGDDAGAFVNHHHYTASDPGCQPPDLLLTARAYTAQGVAVLPIRKGSKAPDLTSWAEYQVRQPTDAELVAWFGNGHGRDALGVVCGQVSGNLVILDFDGDGSEYQAFCTAFPDLAGSRTVITGRGRRHIWLQAAELPASGKHVTAWGPIEIRANGNQTLAPPSIHPDTGQPYTWADPLAPLLQVPDLWGVVAWLKGNTTPAVTPLAPVDGGAPRRGLLPCAVAALADQVDEGARNDTIFALAQHCAAAGLDQDQAAALVLPAAGRWGTPDREAQASIASAYRAG